jgi:AraC-like DNA-binding protein
MIFHSSSLPVADRAAGYEGALRHYFSSFDTTIDVHVDAGAPDSFAASLEPVVIGHLGGAIHCSNSPHRLHAEPVVAGHQGVDFYLVRSGTITFSDHNGTIELASGDMALWRSDAEFLACSNGFEMIALGLPESVLRARAADGGWNIGRRICGESAFASCLAALLRTAAARHQDLTLAEGAILQSAILDAIVQLGRVGRESERTSLSLPARQQEKLDHLKALALRSLQVPDLSPAALAREAGISPRTLHRLFFASGVTFCSWLRDSRLQRCWQELTDPGRRRSTIAAVAFRWGFNDLRTFNRAFSARYGMTPQAARETGSPGHGQP